MAALVTAAAGSPHDPAVVAPPAPTHPAEGPGEAEQPGDERAIARPADAPPPSAPDPDRAPIPSSTAPPPRPAPAADTPAPVTDAAAPPTPPVTPVPATTAPAPTSTASRPTLTVAPPEPGSVRVAGSSWAVERLGSDAARVAASEALGRIRYDWRSRLVGWELRFLDGRRGVRGMTYPDARVIEVYVRRGDTPALLAHVTAHELAHAIDVERFGHHERSTWMAARALRAGTPWFVTDGLSDFASGAGDFAEAFAWWQTGGGYWNGRLGPPPTPVQLGVLEQLTGGP